MAYGAIGDGAEEACGQVDGGARDSRRADDGVPLMITDEGERANQQNETGEPAAGDGCRVTRQEADGGRAIEAPKLGLPDQAAGGGRPRRASKREKKRMREEKTKRELERRASINSKTAGATVADKIQSVEWLLPNVAAVLREHYRGSP